MHHTRPGKIQNLQPGSTSDNRPHIYLTYNFTWVMGLLCHFLVSTMNGQRKQKGLILLAKQQRIINENEQRPLKLKPQKV